MVEWRSSQSYGWTVSGEVWGGRGRGGEEKEGGGEGKEGAWAARGIEKAGSDSGEERGREDE